MKPVAGMIAWPATMWSAMNGSVRAPIVASNCTTSASGERMRTPSSGCPDSTPRTTRRSSAGGAIQQVSRLNRAVGRCSGRPTRCTSKARHSIGAPARCRRPIVSRSERQSSRPLRNVGTKLRSVRTFEHGRRERRQSRGRADLQADVDVHGADGSEAIGKAHRLQEMPTPVGRRCHVIDATARPVRFDMSRTRGGAKATPAGLSLEMRRGSAPSAASGRRARRSAAGALITAQPRASRRRRSTARAPDDDRLRRPVDRGNRDLGAIGASARPRALRRKDRRHGAAGGQRLHQRAARRDEPQGVLQSHRAARRTQPHIRRPSGRARPPAHAEERQQLRPARIRRRRAPAGRSRSGPARLARSARRRSTCNERPSSGSRISSHRSNAARKAGAVA